MGDHDFAFARGRGVVWVCDIEASSKLLNDNKLADSVEAFLPRFHWLARIAVDASGGEFMKWTGDGFLAWFPVELDRQLGQPSLVVLNAAWHLTVLVNVTRLAVNMMEKVKLRHGVAFERDALVTIIEGNEGAHRDIIGRSVVLAFRMSGISMPFPGVVAQKEIVDAAKKLGRVPGRFKKLKINADQRLRYFKGERRGTTSLVASTEATPRRRSLNTVLKHAKAAVAKAEAENGPDGIEIDFARQLLVRMEHGPPWARETITQYVQFLREDMLASLKESLQALEERTN